MPTEIYPIIVIGSIVLILLLVFSLILHSKPHDYPPKKNYEHSKIINPQNSNNSVDVCDLFDYLEKKQCNYDYLGVNSKTNHE